MRIRRRRILRISGFSFTLLTLYLVMAPSFLPRVEFPYTYFSWTGIGSLYTGVGLRVAVVKPVFSATAYSHLFGGSFLNNLIFGVPPDFYHFYDKHVSDQGMI